MGHAPPGRFIAISPRDAPAPFRLTSAQADVRYLELPFEDGICPRTLLRFDG